MALKTWAPYDRLIAEDLNGALGYATGQGLALPGAVCKVAGAAITLTANAATDVALGVPAAGQDPLGYHVPANGRVKIPAGLGGLYLFTVSVVAGAPAGTASTAGHVAQVDLIHSLGVSTVEPLGTFARFDTTVPLGLVGSVVRVMADLEEWIVRMTARGSNGTGAQVKAWSIVRLASVVGAFGS